MLNFYNKYKYFNEQCEFVSFLQLSFDFWVILGALYPYSNVEIDQKQLSGMWHKTYSPLVMALISFCR